MLALRRLLSCVAAASRLLAPSYCIYNEPTVTSANVHRRRSRELARADPWPVSSAPLVKQALPLA